MLVAGDYTVPFEFILPERIPGSVCFSDYTRTEKPECEVKYTI